MKVFVVVLVAIAVLFVVAVAVGFSSSDSDSDDGSFDAGPGGFGLFGDDPATVPASELGGSCQLQGDVLVVQGGCDLEVGSSSDRMRLVRLLTADDIDVTAPAPEDADFDIEKELEAGEEVAIAVDSGGSTIELDCGFGQTCTLTVLGSQS